MKSLRNLGLVAVGILLGALLANAHQASAARTSTRYLAFYEPGANWNYGNDFRQQSGFSKHVAYLHRLAKKKKIVLAGTIRGKDLGLVFPSGKVDKAGFKAIAGASPLVKKGILKFEVRTWDLDVEGKVRSAEDEALGELEGEVDY